MTTSADNGKRPVMKQILELGDTAYNPEHSTDSRSTGITEFDALLKRTGTLALLPVFTSLIQPGRVEPWLRCHLTGALAMLPLRPKGVINTIEFILSIHPSTTGGPSSTEANGPNLSLEALTSISRLISSPPEGMAPELWFRGISSQLVSLLDGEGGLVMMKAASYIIGYGILGRREYGSPGRPGWNIFALPLLSSINPDLSSNQHDDDNEVVIDLVSGKVLVDAEGLAKALRRLASLLSAHPNPGLSKRLLSPVLLPLWSLASWVAKDDEEEAWRAPAMYLLQIFLQLSDASKLLLIVKNLLYNGNSTSPGWRYKASAQCGIETIKIPSAMDSLDMTVLDFKIEAFMNLLQLPHMVDMIPVLFLTLCKKWLRIDVPQEVHIVHSTDVGIEEISISEAKIMQKLMNAVPDQLVGDSTQVLELAAGVLHRAIVAGDIEKDDTVPVAMSLLNIVFTAPRFRPSENKESVLSAKASLRVIGGMVVEGATTARNLLLLLDFQKQTTSTDPLKSTLVDRNTEDQQTYKLAVSYLMSTDSPPPVRAQGLDLIAGLTARRSNALDIPAILLLLASLLQDEEEYIYLRCIKLYVTLSERHPNAVLQALLEQYLDLQEELTLDARLKVGEAILQVIERAGQMFSGSYAHDVGDGLLSIAGRRRNRPRSELRKQKSAAEEQRNIDEAEQAWDGKVPQLEIEESDPVLAHIVAGWEGKRSEEDVRMRSSALAIFGSAIEVNAAGFGSTIISKGLDLSINILAIEPEPEKAILRRSAILLVMSLLRALDTQKLGFGFAGQNLAEVMRLLTYIESTDNDGLVQQHARDVLEGLETWQIKSITEAPRLQQDMSGLSLHVENRLSRPRIEEIE